MVRSGSFLPRYIIPFWLAVHQLISPGSAFAQSKSGSVIAGKVSDQHGNPLTLANVQLIGTAEGDATNTQGEFRFITSRTGKQQLRASLVGYESTVRELNLQVGYSIYIALVLNESTLQLTEVVVTGSAFTTGDEAKGITLRSLEVITTPGASADILRALQMFPGVVSVDEGTGLFVRGGDVSETVIMLDQATVVHPYRYESPTGGYFGTIPPFIMSGTYFSTGGFSARYGNALSGVLAMESLNMPSRTTYSANAGLAAGSIGLKLPIIPGSLGIRFTGNHSFTDLMFRVNRVRNRFVLTPRGSDGNLSVIYQYSGSGQIKFFNFVNTNRIGVRVDESLFGGVFESDETNWLHNLRWKDLLGPWLVKASASLNRFKTEQKLGNMHRTPNDNTLKLRVDAEHSTGDDIRIILGTEMEQLENGFRGTFPKNPGVFHPNAEVFRIDERFFTRRIGAYSELEARLSTRLFGNAGVRVDVLNLTHQAVIDPRLTLKYSLSRELRARLSWGVYHQFPQPMLLSSSAGNRSLHAQTSEHWIAGIDYATDLWMLRAEAYEKRYRKLILPNVQMNYTNEGSGFARGIDFFLKYGAFLQTPINGWFSYSFLHSRRLQARNVVSQYVYEEAPSSFDITHNLTVVFKAQVIQLLSVGLTFRYATGRPVTPIVGAVFHTERQYYEPIQGQVNSERMPDFARVDASLGYFLPFGEANSATFYFGISNLLNRANPVRYEYSPDYSERTLRTTDYRRFIYFGVAVSMGSLGSGLF